MAGKFAEVYLKSKSSEISLPFDYKIPDNLINEIKVGTLVIIPFGKREEIGFVSKIKSQSYFQEKFNEKIKEIKGILFSPTFFDFNKLKLAYWISFYYMSSMGNVFKLFLPPGYNYKINCFLFINFEKSSELINKYPVFNQLISKEKYLEKDLIKIISEKEKINETKAKNIILKLKKENYLITKFELSDIKIKPKFINIYKVNKEVYNKIFLQNVNENNDKIISLKNISQIKIINYLLDVNEDTKEGILKNTNVSDYNLQALVKKNILIKEKKEQKRNFNYDDYIKEDKSKETINLNEYQKNCVDKITSFIGKNINHNFLIEGVTGSGKTEVYIRCVKDALKKNKSSLVLTPEISLTPQLYSNFKSVFHEGLAIYHSGMNDNERYEKWLDILEGKSKIIIGTRSALFTPIKDLGLIIVDEQHDVSYKENFTVRYNAIDVVIKLGKILKIPVVFGSATPSINLKYKLSNNKDSTILNMPQKIHNDVFVVKKVIDLKKVNKFKEDEVITNELFYNIKNEIDKNKKVIIFINRRGYSNFVICNNCGFIPKCPNCDLAFTFHKIDKKLKCHHCGYEVFFSEICPSCNSKRLSLYGTGIQKVESKLKQRFPDVFIIRMDSDVTSKKKSHEKILNEFISHNPSILIGTQMISKGLDIKDVSLVGVINIDSMFALPDFHINERIFSLLTQVSGRTGRSNDDGKVIIQTFKPESTIIQNFINDDYNDFYKNELLSRKELNYPPFTNLINIIISSKEEKLAKSEIYKIYDKLINIINNEDDKISGPSPAPFVKLNQYYRWHILVKTFKINKFISSFTKLLKVIKINKNCRFIVDIDPEWIL